MAFRLEHLRRILAVARGRAHILQLADDYGAQNGLMLSRDAWLRFFAPHLRTMAEMALDAGRMDPAGLKRDFGDRLCFHGAVDTQSTLPFGTEEDVVAEVRDRIEVLGKGGGYIMAPVHTVEPDVPVENLLAAYRAARECGTSW